MNTSNTISGDIQKNMAIQQCKSPGQDKVTDTDSERPVEPPYFSKNTHRAGGFHLSSYGYFR